MRGIYKALRSPIFVQHPFELLLYCTWLYLNLPPLPPFAITIGFPLSSITIMYYKLLELQVRRPIPPTDSLRFSP
jgi:hypothetical protein